MADALRERLAALANTLDAVLKLAESYDRVDGVNPDPDGPDAMWVVCPWCGVPRNGVQCDKHDDSCVGVSARRELSELREALAAPADVPPLPEGWTATGLPGYRSVVGATRGVLDVWYDAAEGTVQVDDNGVRICRIPAALVRALLARHGGG